MSSMTGGAERDPFDWPKEFNEPEWLTRRKARDANIAERTEALRRKLRAQRGLPEESGKD